jgi:hypothetical protein
VSTKFNVGLSLILSMLAVSLADTFVARLATRGDKLRIVGTWPCDGIRNDIPRLELPLKDVTLQLVEATTL